MKFRDYQERIIADTLGNFNEGIQAMVINLFTGGGKTVLAAGLAKEWKRKYGGQVLFLVDQIELAYQAAEEFAEFDPAFRVGIEMNIHQASANDDIVIGCVATMGKGSGGRIGRFNPDDFSLVICDEAHKSIAPIWRKVLSYFGTDRVNFADGKGLLGFTATVQRSDKKPLGQIYDDVVGGLDIRWAVANGWATDIEIYQIQTNIDISNISYNKDTGEFNQLELDRAVNVANRNAQIFKAYKEISDGELAVIYCASVDHAHEVAKLFNDNGVSAFCIEANTDKFDRKDAIKRFKEGDIKVLTNYMTLTTGFNVRDVTTGIFARPIGSQTTYIQALGRFVRPSEFALVDMMPNAESRKAAIKNSSKPFAKIIDFMDVTDSNSVVTIPSLFGLNDRLQMGEKKKFFKEVLEPLEELQETQGVDIRHIVDPNEVEIYIKRKSMSMRYMKPTDHLKELSKSKWYEVKDDVFQMNLPKAKLVLRVEQNDVGKWEVISHDLTNGVNTLMNRFTSLSGAVKLADDYAHQVAKEDMRLSNIDATWRDRGLSKAHWEFFMKLFKWQVLPPNPEDTYTDTGMPKLHLKKTGELVTRGVATDMLEQKQTNAKIKSNEKKEAKERKSVADRHNNKGLGEISPGPKRKTTTPKKP